MKQHRESHTNSLLSRSSLIDNETEPYNESNFTEKIYSLNSESIQETNNEN